MDSKEEYWKFVESERHFNMTQAGIRTRASTWILAAFLVRLIPAVRGYSKDAKTRSVRKKTDCITN